MTTHDLAPFVTAFFTRHLPAERKASPNTIAAYRDTLKLLLRFLAASMHRTAAALHVEDLSPDRILDFLEDLETTRRNTIRTRNARLAAIHSFFRYVLDTEPALALLCQRVLSIPVKKAPRPVLGYLSDTELAHVLAQIDRSTQVGERDYPLWLSSTTRERASRSSWIWLRAMSDSSHLRLSGSTAKADANGSRPCCRKPLGWCDASSPRQDAAKTRRRR